MGSWRSSMTFVVGHLIFYQNHGMQGLTQQSNQNKFKLSEQLSTPSNLFYFSFCFALFLSFIAGLAGTSRLG